MEFHRLLMELNIHGMSILYLYFLNQHLNLQLGYGEWLSYTICPEGQPPRPQINSSPKWASLAINSLLNAPIAEVGRYSCSIYS